MHELPVQHNFGNEGFAITPALHPCRQCLIGPPCYILTVLGTCNYAQVLKAIVCRITIDVINLAIRPVPGAKSPDDPMCLKPYRVKTDETIPIVVDRTNYLPGVLPVPRETDISPLPPPQRSI